MGVMQCDRRGCRYIMCHMRLTVPNNGGQYYLCPCCATELLTRADCWPERISDSGLERRLIRFLSEESKPLPEGEKSARDRVDQLIERF